MKLYIVALENQFTATGFEYFNVDKDGVLLLGYHNPSSAKTFPLISEAKSFIEQFITFEGMKIFVLDAEVKKFTDWMLNGCLYRSLPIKNKSLSRKYNGESKIEVLKWWIAYTQSNDFEIAQEDYGSWPHLYSMFKHLHSVEGFEDDSITFSLFTPKDGKFKDFKKELDLISPYCTCIDKKEGKIYHIFDHYLSEGGNSVSLIEYSHGDFSVRSGSGSLIVSGNLEVCFDYLKRERWYE